VDSNLFLRCAVRWLTQPVRELFDLSPLTQAGYEFFTDYASLWHRVDGKFCIGSKPFEAPVWGSEEAALMVFRPQTPQ
jgi:hypothetical protein